MSPIRRKSSTDPLAAVLPLSSVATHVLLALADGNRHGLGIAAQIEEATSGRVSMGPGTLYGAIKRLLDTGLIDDTDDSPEGNEADPRRRYYRITPLGRQALAVEATQLANLVRLAKAKRVL